MDYSPVLSKHRRPNGEYRGRKKQQFLTADAVVLTQMTQIPAEMEHECCEGIWVCK